MITESGARQRNAVEYWRSKPNDEPCHHLGLHTALPKVRQSEHELGLAGYRRIKVGRSPGEGWGLSGRTVWNVVRLEWPPMRADRETRITHVSIARADGTILHILPLDPAVVMAAGQTGALRFEPKAIRLTSGDDDDTDEPPSSAACGEVERAVARATVIEES